MRKIVFSPRSKFQLDSLLDYLEIRFSVSTKKKFVLKLDKVIIIIQKDPDTFSKLNSNTAIIKTAEAPADTCGPSGITPSLLIFHI